ncbi:MAG: proton-conducting transporter membrane subunit, partial [Chloroflexi bacterium]|nr:proton-conducting transporter membrane subunit [Chloroflexota bacterium]
RMHPSLGGMEAWGIVLPLVGGFTMVLGAVLAVRERDLKLLLAYSTVSALGWMVMLAGFGTPDAMKALAVTVIAHAGYKAALFMTAGTIDHETGTRDRLALGGLRRPMPVLAASAMVAAIAMAGLPPALGFLSKETSILAAFDEEPGWLLAGSLGVMGALSLVAAWAAGVAPFLGATTETPKHAHEGPIALWAPVALLGCFGLAAGLLGPVLLEPFIGSVVTATYGSPYEVHLTFWAGLDRVLAVSVVAIVSGAILVRYHASMPGIPWLPVQSTTVTQAALDGLSTLAGRVERLAQHGSLPLYIATAMTVAVVPLLAVTASAGPLENVALDSDPWSSRWAPSSASAPSPPRGPGRASARLQHSVPPDSGRL